MMGGSSIMFSACLSVCACMHMYCTCVRTGVPVEVFSGLLAVEFSSYWNAWRLLTITQTCRGKFLRPVSEWFVVGCGSVLDLHEKSYCCLCFTVVFIKVETWSKAVVHPTVRPSVNVPVFLMPGAQNDAFELSLLWNITCNSSNSMLEGESTSQHGPCGYGKLFVLSRTTQCVMYMYFRYKPEVCGWQRTDTCERIGRMLKVTHRRAALRSLIALRLIE